MGWRSAKSIDSSVGLGDEIQATNPSVILYYIGDSAHCPGSSDHCDCSCCDVVCAVDVMKNGGPNMDALAEHIRQKVLAGDQRTKYLIWNKRIFSGHGQDYSPGVWRGYSGSNPHTDHVHLSIRHGSSLYDDSSSWGWSGSSGSTPPPTTTEPTYKDPTTKVSPPLNYANLPTLKKGASGQQVRNLQGMLVAAGRGLTVDGQFGSDTESKLKNWQSAAGLTADGICGQATWGGLYGAPYVVQNGHKGQYVKNCQGLLVGANRLKNADVDGYFGSSTTSALKAWQSAVKLTSDGICGHDTWRALIGCT